ncbi:hypothetical protein ABXT06_04525 [Flavobacterium sp. UW10123]|uniref:hypothetical protein n=1 Tax=Flavobacterium sp. UW10123 TaxID=3230800 RepID=UPI0033980416
MNSNKLKKKVLRHLLVFKDGSPIDKIIEKTGFDEITLEVVLGALLSEQYVVRSNEYKGCVITWKITDKGINALLIKQFDKLSLENILKVGPLLISILALIVSIIALFD